MKKLTCAAALFLALSLLSACVDDESEKTYTLQFSAKVGEQPFACGRSYDNVGTPANTFEPLDFRMYVHGVTLLAKDGSEVELELQQDKTWQRDSIALLDFEDGTGACETNSPQMHTKIVGKAKEQDYVGIKFTVGIPEASNHIDAATAPAPLNASGLWWSWQGGYRFLRLDVKTATTASYAFHLGETNCSANDSGGFSCQYPNLATITLSNFDPLKNVIVFDVAAVFADADFDHDGGGVDGCMAFPGDPECVDLFGKLGMPFADADPAGVPEQSAFYVE